MKESCPHTFKLWGAWSGGCYQTRQLTCITCGDGLGTDSRTEHNMVQAVSELPSGGIYRYLKCSRCGRT
jgi:hypothetical protein